MVKAADKLRKITRKAQTDDEHVNKLAKQALDHVLREATRAAERRDYHVKAPIRYEGCVGGNDFLMPKVKVRLCELLRREGLDFSTSGISVEVKW